MWETGGKLASGRWINRRCRSLACRVQGISFLLATPHTAPAPRQCATRSHGTTSIATITSRLPALVLPPPPTTVASPPAVRVPPRRILTTMAAPAAASLVARASLLPRLGPTAAYPLSSSVHGPRSRSRHLRLRGSPSPAGTAAASSSPSVPSASPESGSGIGDTLGDVEIYSAATGEPVLFRDLWDQNEVVEMRIDSSFSYFA